MADLKELFQSADWKTEKHVPVIEVPDSVKKAEFFKVTVSVGKAVPHPNKTEHHISWIEVYFHPLGEKFPYRIGKVENSMIMAIDVLTTWFSMARGKRNG